MSRRAYSNLVGLERGYADSCLGSTFVASNVGATERHVGEKITIGLSGGHWDLVGLVESFEDPCTIRGRIVDVQRSPDQYCQGDEDDE